MNTTFKVVVPASARPLMEEIKDLTGISSLSAAVVYSLKRTLRSERTLAAEATGAGKKDAL